MKKNIFIERVTFEFHGIVFSQNSITHFCITRKQRVFCCEFDLAKNTKHWYYGPRFRLFVL